MRNPLLSSSTISGTDVVNMSGKNLGNIKDLMIDTSTGSIQYAVLSFGGFMGMGDKYFAVPWNSFSIDTKNENLMLNVEQERLERAPGFDEDNWPGQADDYYSRVETYYQKAHSV